MIQIFVKIKSLQKPLVTLVTLLVFLFCVSPDIHAQRDTKEKLQSQKTRLEDEIKLANHLLKEMGASRKEGMSTLEALTQKIKIREQLIQTLIREARLLDREIAEQEERIGKLEKELEQQQEVYAQMIRKAFASKNKKTKILFILSSRDFYQAVKRVQYLRQISLARQTQIEKIQHTRESIREELRELAKQKADKEKLLNKQRNERESLIKDRQEQESQLVNLRGQQEEIEKDIRKKQEQRQKLEKEIQRLIAAEIKKAREEAERRNLEDRAQKIGLIKGKDFTSRTTNRDLETKIQTKLKETKKTEEPSSPQRLQLTPEARQLAANFEANKSKLPWPVERGLMVSRFGKQNHAIAKQVIIDNKGIDIATEKGSKARAVFDGVVSSIIRIPGANKAILVKHGNYFTVYSNITDVFVKEGDQVKTGQEIGLIYTEEESGKTTLHF